VFCPEKATLIETYTNARRLCLYAFKLLRDARAKGSREAYEDAKRISEDAHNQCDAARRELEMHITRHGC
jgi:hypothetical protein